MTYALLVDRGAGVTASCPAICGWEGEVEWIRAGRVLHEEDVGQLTLDVVVPGEDLRPRGGCSQRILGPAERFLIPVRIRVVAGEDTGHVKMRRVGVGPGLQERIEPVVDAPLQLGDERQGRVLLGATAGVAGRDEQEREDDADDRDHHHQLDQGESQAQARPLRTELEPRHHCPCSQLTHDLQSRLRVRFRFPQECSNIIPACRYGSW